MEPWWLVEECSDKTLLGSRVQAKDEAEVRERLKQLANREGLPSDLKIVRLNNFFGSRKGPA